VGGDRAGAIAAAREMTNRNVLAINWCYSTPRHSIGGHAVPNLFRIILRARSGRLWSDRRGVTALEYGLIASIIFASILVGFSLMADSLSNQFDGVGTCVANGPTDPSCTVRAPG
jgi:pilus assembly protein Flp/PilA